MQRLGHLDGEGRARMVDVGGKEVTEREAVARAIVRMKPETLGLIKDGAIRKGDVLAIAQVAAIMAAKRTPDLIPLCHPLEITAVEMAFDYPDESAIEITATVRTLGRTGVEMEAMVAAAAAGLTVYDMCKGVDRAMTIERVELLRKSGGKSGEFIREEVAP